jgi:carboxyl-terminal processing protease
VFDSFIDALDPSRIVLLKSEYELLSLKYRFNLDNFIHENDCSFLSGILTVYKNGLLRNKSLLERMKTETIDYKQRYNSVL